MIICKNCEWLLDVSEKWREYGYVTMFRCELTKSCYTSGELEESEGMVDCPLLLEVKDEI